MFCKNCGAKLMDGAVFCTECGTKQMEMPEVNSQQEKLSHENIQQTTEESAQPEGKIEDKKNTFSTIRNSSLSTTIAKKFGNILDIPEVNGQQEKLSHEDIQQTTEESAQPEGKTEGKKNIFSTIWNSSLFTTIATKFGFILDILLGVIAFVFGRMSFQEGGFWGIGLGIFLMVVGVFVCLASIINLFSREENHGSIAIQLFFNRKETKSDKDIIRIQKIIVCIGIVVIVIALPIALSSVVKSGWGTYSMVQEVSFDEFGYETIGELIDKNIRRAEWSKQKLDNHSTLVYVEGYCLLLGETIRIEFYCEEADDSYEVSLNGMYLPESNEELNQWESAIVWMSFYDD